MLRWSHIVDLIGEPMFAYAHISNIAYGITAGYKGIVRYRRADARMSASGRRECPQIIEKSGSPHWTIPQLAHPRGCR